MKKIKLLFFCLSFFVTLHAQKKAVTDNGDPVILYDDGTWKYADSLHASDDSISTNSHSFVKSANQSFLIKSKRCNMGFWIDPKKWNFEKSTDGGAKEFEMLLKNQDLHGAVVSEQIEVPMESLKEAAIKNALQIAPDVHVVQEEYRMVNGLKVLFLQMNGSAKGMKFCYYGYYYSNAGGTVQFLTYTTQNLFAKYKKEADEFLNGLVEIK
jgi:hypothetical protein